MSFASRLKEQRLRMNFTQAELANILGVTKSAIGNYETGLNSPKAEILFKVFEVLKCDANYLFQDEMADMHEETASPEEMNNLVKRYRRLDTLSQKLVLSVIEIELERCNSISSRVLGGANKKVNNSYTVSFRISDQPASAGTGVYLGPDGFTEHMVNAEAVKGADFGVPVSGDSMEPLYKDGDIILVSMSSPVRMGDIALVTMDGCGYVKKLGKGVLISVNHHYDPIPVTEDIRINGKVIGVLPAQIE